MMKRLSKLTEHCEFGGFLNKALHAHREHISILAITDTLSCFVTLTKQHNTAPPYYRAGSNRLFSNNSR